MSRTVYFHFLLCFRQTFGIFSQDLWNIPSLSETAVHIQPLLYFIELATVTQPLHYPLSSWKVVPHHRGLRPLLFTNSSVGSFTSNKNQNSERAVRRGQRFFVLIREDQRLLGCRTYIFWRKVACILRKRLVHVTGSNIFPGKHQCQIPRWRQLRNLYGSYVLQNMLPSWRRSITCKNPSLLAPRSALTTASKHSSCLLGSSPATTCKRLISACLGVL